MEKTVTFDNIYTLIREDNEMAENLKEVLCLENWFNSIFEFDPVTNKPLPSTNDYLLSKINEIETKSTLFWWNDRIENIIEFIEAAVYSLFDLLHDKIVSEHIVTQASKVKETDSISIRWLGKKPGKTVRQKIADSGKMMGVFHLASIDTTENRLLKNLLLRLDSILYEKELLSKKSNFSAPDSTQNFILKIHRWLKSEDAEFIGQWNNGLPNNTLLNDKNYRKIWNAWCELNQVNDYLQNEISHLDELKATYYFWNKLSNLSIEANYYLLQSPVFEKENVLEIVPYTNAIEGCFTKNEKLEQISFELDKGKRKIYKICGKVKSSEEIPDVNFIHNKKNNSLKQYKAACCAFDFKNVQPYFATDKNENGILDIKLIYQTWKDKENQNKTIEVDCSHSKMISTEKPFVNVTIYDFFKTDYKLSEHANPYLAAKSFSNAIKQQLQCEKYYYLFPDETDDFSPMQVALRHQLNLKFSNLNPIPRSIAKIFQIYQKEGKKILQKKFFVVDFYDTHLTITKVLPKKSDSLIKNYPDSDGIVFEHFPSDIIYAENDSEDYLFTLHDKKQLDLYIDGNKISDGGKLSSLPFLQKKLSEFKNKQEPDYEYVTITPNDNVTFGALIYDNLQAKTPDITLWREHLPPLSLETDGQKLILVDENTTGISPRKGEEKEIKVNATFEMPKGKDFYEFSLFKGENKTKSYAYLKDDSFPLSKNVKCSLHLTYTYGEEQPYKLRFVPNYSAQEKSPFQYVQVKWESVSHRDYRKLPFPDFCKEYTWDDMRHYEGRKNERGNVSNFVDEWLPAEFEKIISFGTFYKINKIEKVDKKLNRIDTSLILIDPKSSEMFETKIASHRELKEDDKIICSKIDVNAKNPCLQSEMKILRIKSLFKKTKISDKQENTFVTEVFLDYESGVYCFLVSKTSDIKIGDKVICCIQSTEKGYNAFNAVLEKEYGNKRSYAIKEIKESSLDSHKKYRTSVFLKSEDTVVGKAPYAKISSNTQLQVGDIICCSDIVTEKKFSLLSEAKNQFYKSLRMPVITAWGNGRSIEDKEVPVSLRELFCKAKENAFKLVLEPCANKDLKDEMLFFLCTIHKDTLAEVKEKLVPLLLHDDYLPKYTRHLSYIIGDCSSDWQMNILKKIISNLSQDSLRTYSLKILASSLWRVRTCVYKLSLTDINSIIDAIQLESKRILFDLRKRKINKINDGILYTCCLEILLALFRLRETDDSQTLETLSPAYNEKLSLCVKNLTSISKLELLEVKQRFTFSSKLTLQETVEKYASGNLGENEIKILSVEEDEEE